jgi:hypothetical protein
VTVAAPAAEAVATPRLPEALLMLTPVEADQVADWVTSATVPSVYVPVALNCSVVPVAIDAFTGLTTTDTNLAGNTCNVDVAVTVPDAPGAAAEIVTVPGLIALARPHSGVVLPTGATAGFDELHATVVLMSLLVPSL